MIGKDMNGTPVNLGDFLLHTEYRFGIAAGIITQAVNISTLVDLPGQVHPDDGSGWVQAAHDAQVLDSCLWLAPGGTDKELVKLKAKEWIEKDGKNKLQS